MARLTRRQRQKKVALLVLDKDYLELRNYLGTDVHGILGYELFSRFVIKIDYERKVLVIQNPDSFVPKRKFEMVPINVEDTKPYVEANVQMNDSTRSAAKLLIDTGASLEKPPLTLSSSSKFVLIFFSS